MTRKCPGLATGEIAPEEGRAKSLMTNYCLSFFVITVYSYVEEGMIYCSLVDGILMGKSEEVVVMSVV